MPPTTYHGTGHRPPDVHFRARTRQVSALTPGHPVRIWRRATVRFPFHVDRHPDTPDADLALEGLRKACGFFKILGI
jgi:hypothetical protein